MMYGLPPYYNKNQSVMFKLIKEGELKFNEKLGISEEAKDFITKVDKKYFILILKKVFKQRCQ